MQTNANVCDVKQAVRGRNANLTSTRVAQQQWRISQLTTTCCLCHCYQLTNDNYSPLIRPYTI